MFKKTRMLGLCVVALAALALPASAMANWTDGTVALTQSKTLELTGTEFKFNSGPSGSIGCNMTAQMILHPGSTGTVTMFSIDGTPTAACITGGALMECQMHTWVATGYGGNLLTEEPWLMHTDTNDVTITTGVIHTTATGQFCPTTNVSITSGTLTAQADNSHGISTLTLSGTLQTDSALGKFATAITSVQHVKAPDAGTYGVT